MKRLLLLVLLVIAPTLARAEKAAEAPTVMSAYEVRANSVEFKQWLKIGSQNFILYTDAPAAEASVVLHEFEMLHFAGQVAFGRRASRFGPIILILPTASSDWRKLESKGGAEEWHSAATTVGGRVVDVIVIQYDWQDHGRSLVRAAYANVARDRMEIGGPFWFNRGVGSFYETADFDGAKVQLGTANPRIGTLVHGNWLPWGRFFEVKAKSQEFIKEDAVEQYEAQASLFTQYIFTNPDRSWIGKLVAWVEYLKTGARPTEARFAAIFGQDWKTWQDTMETYLDGGRYNVFSVAVPPEVARVKETRYRLPVKEMRELFVLTQTLLQDVPESKTALDALLASGLQSETLRELLVESCFHWKRRDVALENVRKLIADGSRNARVYRQGDALLTSYAGSFNLDCRYGPEMAEVREWDRRGLELEPLYSNLNNSLAVNEACAPMIDQQSITTIEECYARLRGRAPTDEVIAALAMALWRSGDSKMATELTKRLRDDPLSEKRSRELASRLLSRIERGVKPDSAAGS